MSKTITQTAGRDQHDQARPGLAEHIDNMDDYDVILLGYPNWWASILLARFGRMLMFMMIPAMTPIDAGIVHVGLTLAGALVLPPASASSPGWC